MVGITLNNPVFTYGDNQSMVWASLFPDYTPKNISSATAHHFFIEVVVRKEWITGYIKTSEKKMELMTKTVLAG